MKELFFVAQHVLQVVDLHLQGEILHHLVKCPGLPFNGSLSGSIAGQKHQPCTGTLMKIVPEIGSQNRKIGRDQGIPSDISKVP